MIENITRKYIEQLSDIEPYCFETDREEWWFNIGLKHGLEAADAEPNLEIIWHDASDIPNDDSLIIYESVYGDILLKRFTNRASAMANVLRWAYIDTILPKAMIQMDAIDVVKGMLSSSISKEKWTKCPMFRCVMNTGWAAGDDRYKCRIGKDCNSCGAINRTKKPIIVKL